MVRNRRREARVREILRIDEEGFSMRYLLYYVNGEHLAVVYHGSLSSVFAVVALGLRIVAPACDAMQMRLLAVTRLPVEPTGCGILLHAFSHQALVPNLRLGDDVRCPHMHPGASLLHCGAG